MYRKIIVLLLGFVLCQSHAQNEESGAELRIQGQFVSTTTTVPPLAVSSSDTVGNLSADKLDGFDVGDFAVEGSGVGVHYKNLVGVPGEEIDQVCAVNTGCFSGDTAGFPVTITEPGSYRMASNLDVSGASNPENVSAVEIDASNVTLDMQGFAIKGPGVAGDGIGIYQTSFVHSATIMNGSIEGMGSYGMYILRKGIVMRIRAYSNGEAGIRCEYECVVADNVTSSNGGTGIVVIAEGIVTGNVARANGRDGISGVGSSRVSNNIAAHNDLYGLDFNSTDIGYAGNVMEDNGTANVRNGTQLGKNLCGSSLC